MDKQAPDKMIKIKIKTNLLQKKEFTYNKKLKKTHILITSIVIKFIRKWLKFIII